MFDPILDLRRRRMQQSGLPEITGNVQPPQVGPDVAAAPPPQPMLMQMPSAPEQNAAPYMAALSQLGAQRGMEQLLNKLKPEQAAGPSKALSGLPVLKNLFRR